jgi:hypothetical protein
MAKKPAVKKKTAKKPAVKKPSPGVQIIELPEVANKIEKSLVFDAKGEAIGYIKEGASEALELADKYLKCGPLPAYLQERYGSLKFFVQEDESNG